MRKLTYQYPKSSFISIEKDMGMIVDMMLKNDRLKKLLYYTTKDCLSKPNLTDEQTAKLFSERYIRMTNKIYVDDTAMNYIVISFDNFTPNMDNPYYRDNIIYFDVICHYDQWELGDFQLRPYKIAAEIDTLFNDKHLSGIGTLNFVGAGRMIYGDEFAGLSMMYSAVHADDDQKHSPNQTDQEDIDDNFDKIFNDLGVDEDWILNQL